MEIVKVEFKNDTRLIVVVNEKKEVLTVSAFTDRENADAAANLVWTLMLRLGLTKFPAPKDKLRTLDEVLKLVDQNAI